MKRNKKEPLRMCIACKQMKPKSELIKLYKTKEGSFSFQKNTQGRGGYLCKDKNCLSKCIKKRLFNKAFKTIVPQTVYDKLGELYERLEKD